VTDGNEEMKQGNGSDVYIRNLRDKVDGYDAIDTINTAIF